ncbi:conserved hypothetical protein [Ricinus communis]|uniref:Uncharacterized protein n=1 Tax=Ricinus communis TaxID=3988 RepID=B9SAN8_RICCO|nr:conserved hypothetical protein [Ricinus communis]
MTIEGRERERDSCPLRSPAPIDFSLEKKKKKKKSEDRRLSLRVESSLTVRLLELSSFFVALKHGTGLAWSNLAAYVSRVTSHFSHNWDFFHCKVVTSYLSMMLVSLNVMLFTT